MFDQPEKEKLLISLFPLLSEKRILDNKYFEPIVVAFSNEFKGTTKGIYILRKLVLDKMGEDFLFEKSRRNYRLLL